MAIERFVVVDLLSLKLLIFRFVVTSRQMLVLILKT